MGADAREWDFTAAPKSTQHQHQQPEPRATRNARQRNQSIEKKGLDSCMAIEMSYWLTASECACIVQSLGKYICGRSCTGGQKVTRSFRGAVVVVSVSEEKLRQLLL